VPEIDAFAKRRRNSDDAISKELAQASSAISIAMNSVSSMMSSNQKENRNDYMLAIEKALSRVSVRNKTKCLIEVLQIIQKYEETL